MRIRSLLVLALAAGCGDSDMVEAPVEPREPELPAPWREADRLGTVFPLAAMYLVSDLITDRTAPKGRTTAFAYGAPGLGQYHRFTLDHGVWTWYDVHKQFGDSAKARALADSLRQEIGRLPNSLLDTKDIDNPSPGLIQIRPRIGPDIAAQSNPPDGPLLIGWDLAPGLMADGTFAEVMLHEFGHYVMYQETFHQSSTDWPPGRPATEYAKLFMEQEAEALVAYLLRYCNPGAAPDHWPGDWRARVDSLMGDQLDYITGKVSCS